MLPTFTVSLLLMYMDQQVLQRMRRYCDYRERCHSEVRSKLLSIKVYGQELEEIIGALVEEGLLNEVRFAKAYARGKHRFNHWGRIKIKQGLKQKQISEYCIRKGLAEIDEEEYLDNLKKLFDKLNIDQSNRDKSRIVRTLIRKGYEYPLIQQLLTST